VFSGRCYLFEAHFYDSTFFPRIRFNRVIQAVLRGDGANGESALGDGKSRNVILKREQTFKYVCLTVAPNIIVLRCQRKFARHCVESKIGKQNSICLLLT